MLNLQDFLRGTPAPLVREYFGRAGIELLHVDWNAPQKRFANSLLHAVDNLGVRHRQRVNDDADRISVMARDDGQAALYDTNQHKQQLDSLDNGYARATWVFLYDPAAWEHAEQTRYADEKRFGKRWDGYVAPKGLAVARDPQSKAAFEAAIAAEFQSSNVEVEVCDRARTQARGRTIPLVQTAIFFEGRKGDRRAFVAGCLDRVPDLPVSEAAIAYCPDTGELEVVASTRQTREVLVRMFATAMLGTIVNGERLPLRQYYLNHLRRPHQFSWDSGDGIDEVTVTLLRLMPIDAGDERVTLECMRGATRSIWAMAEERFGENNPLLSGHRITQVRLRIRFAAQARGRGRRTLPVVISMPHGCDLKGKTSRERLIGEKYLERWGLLRSV